jgi:hypothetical protein
MAENKGFRHVTSGAYAKKGPVMKTSLFSGHWGLNPLGFGSMRIDKGYQEYRDEAKYKNVEAVRGRFAEAMKGKPSIAKLASQKCSNVKGSKARCFVSEMASAGRERL